MLKKEGKHPSKIVEKLFCSLLYSKKIKSNFFVYIVIIEINFEDKIFIFIHEHYVDFIENFSQSYWMFFNENIDFSIL